MLAEPASAVTGGFELMHQLLDSLRDELFRVYRRAESPVSISGMQRERAKNSKPTPKRDSGII